MADRTSVGRLSSRHSVLTEDTDIQFGNQDRMNIQLCGKMTVVIMVPVAALVSLASVTMVGVTQQINAIVSSQESINNYLLTSQLVQNLQVERGSASIVLGSQKPTVKAFQKLLAAQANVDRLVVKYHIWPKNGLFVLGKTITSQTEFSIYLQRSRDSVIFMIINEQYNKTIDHIISAYTSVNQALIKSSIKNMLIPSTGNLWTKVVLTNLLLLATDYIGIQRAMGAMFHMKCHMTAAERQRLAEVNSKAQELLTFSFKFNDTLEILYADLITSLEASIRTFDENEISTSAFINICLNSTENGRYIKSLHWFNNMTWYIKTLNQFKSNAISQILQILKQQSSKSLSDLIQSAVLMGVVCSLCLVLSVFHARSIINANNKVVSCASKARSKTRDLAVEKKRTEYLLHQMLPKAVAEQLILGHKVKAEYFDSATVYFSDILGFSGLCTMLSPYQVVDLLNELYSLLDTCIGHFDVYKVETNGDHYMVVSGVPTKNETHAKDIALMSLEVLECVTRFQPSYSITREARLEIRIGLHSGPCMGGVVGFKTPRYCLFGDTVNTASRMQSTGTAQRINLSESTKKELVNCGGFDVQPRGEVSVKGKGMMMTYYLLRHKSKPILSHAGCIRPPLLGDQSPDYSGQLGIPVLSTEQTLGNYGDFTEGPGVQMREIMHQ